MIGAMLEAPWWYWIVLCITTIVRIIATCINN